MMTEWYSTLILSRGVGFIMQIFISQHIQLYNQNHLKYNNKLVLTYYKYLTNEDIEFLDFSNYTDTIFNI